MKKLKNITCLLLISLFIISSVFTGCKKDDDNGNNPSPAPQTGTFTDSRDGHVYNWVKIGDQVWMAENLAYKPRILGYLPYDNDINNVAIYGYLYSWDIAQSVVPDGWHLPSQAEFQTLVDYLGGENAAYTKLLEKGSTHWDSSNDATNTSGFTALPAGYFDSRSDEFMFLGSLTMFLSSTEYRGSESVIGLTINQNLKRATIEGKPKALYQSIRCVKN